MQLSREQRIYNALQSFFTVQYLEIINQSHLHSGHAGDDFSGESHFKLIIAAEELKTRSRVEQHRLVHKALGPRLLDEIHALTINIKFCSC